MGVGVNLRDADLRVGREVAVGGGALAHGIDGAHAAVLLEAHAALVNVRVGVGVRVGVRGLGLGLEG